ncbi:MAG: helix-turn-helix transcriptional regulator [Clostridia bacterium]|nr:helix-turn-helix transcriptional regulator [Clostridia bacterium]
MNNTFSRIITLLRKERGISQKQAAMELGVSQALLSHYEKGIRQCGLEFVVKVADYYNVSCDYLLGRTADKSGAIIAVEEIPSAESAESDNKVKGSILPVLNKKLLFNSMNIIFNLLQRCDNKALTNAVSSYLMLSVYAAFRQLYAANPKNPDVMFSIPAYEFQADVQGSGAKLLAQAGQLAAGGRVGEEVGLEADKAPLILPDNLAREYPLFASSLLNLLRKAEDIL